MGVVAAVVLGGAALGSGVMSAMGASSAAAAQAQAQKIAQQQANFKNEWAHAAASTWYGVNLRYSKSIVTTEHVSSQCKHDCTQDKLQAIL